jgi:ribosomal protein L30E
MDIRVRVYKHKKTGKIRIADHSPGQRKEWIELYTFVHKINPAIFAFSHRDLGEINEAIR